LKQDLTPVDVARGHILAACNPLGVERVALSDVALDPAPRFLGAPLSSTRNLPAFDNSAMDGYAVGPLVGPMLGEAPFSLRLVGQSLAGHGTDIVVGAGEAIAITTGAPIPKGTFAVVMREQCDESRVKDGVVVKHTPGAGEHIRRAGEDVTRGRVVADVGARLTPARLNLLWSAGHVAVDVVRRPTVAILASGDELKEIGAPLTDDDVVNSNAWAIAAACRRLGCQVRLLGIAQDTLEDHVRRMEIDDVDVLLTIGGVSVGSHDFVRPALEHLGAELTLWRLAMRPGKPLAFGALPRGRRPVHFFGLPGNPVSAMVTFRLFVQPALLRLAGAGDVEDERRLAVLGDAQPFTKKAGLAFYARAVIGRDGDRVVVRTVDRQGSGQISGLADANALACFPADAERIEPGQVVEVLPL
jgi:molybdopterin molybdotransferase